MSTPVKVMPSGFPVLGAYSLTAKSGSLAATIAAASTLFSARWGTATGNLALIERLAIAVYTNANITTQVVTDFELIMARAFTASDSGGTAHLPTGHINKRRTANMITTLFTDIRISSTAALTAGTRTVDARGLRTSGFGFTGTTAPARWFLQDSVLLWDAYQGGGNFNPIVLAQDEGILLRNIAAGPATGTWIAAVNMDWMEVGSY